MLTWREPGAGVTAAMPAPVIVVGDVDEAITAVNDTECGLAAALHNGCAATLFAHWAECTVLCLSLGGMSFRSQLGGADSGDYTSRAITSGMFSAPSIGNREW
ncbi:hypothetical protein APR11_006675 [Nocardia amikacinitolerans]|nr:hypothetical protein [Nocardia amikacinitolerans]